MKQNPVRKTNVEEETTPGKEQTVDRVKELLESFLPNGAAAVNEHGQHFFKIGISPLFDVFTCRGRVGLVACYDPT